MVLQSQKAEATVKSVNASVTAVSARWLNAFSPMVSMAMATPLSGGVGLASVPPTISNPGFSFAILVLRIYNSGLEISKCLLIVILVVVGFLLGLLDVVRHQRLESVDLDI